MLNGETKTKRKNELPDEPRMQVDTFLQHQESGQVARITEGKLIIIREKKEQSLFPIGSKRTFEVHIWEKDVLPAAYLDAISASIVTLGKDKWEQIVSNLVNTILA